jgi:hypothetical protein
MTRRRMEAAVATNGEPGIMVAHSMGNLVCRYFLVWLRAEMPHEAYRLYVKRAKKRAQTMLNQQQQQNNNNNSNNTNKKAATPTPTTNGSPTGGGDTKEQQQQQQPWAAADSYTAFAAFYLPGWMNGVVSSFDELYDWITSDYEEPLIHNGNNNADNDASERRRLVQLWELAVSEGDVNWLEWLETPVWAMSA